MPRRLRSCDVRCAHGCCSGTCVGHYDDGVDPGGNDYADSTETEVADGEGQRNDWHTADASTDYIAAGRTDADKSSGLFDNIGADVASPADMS